MWQKRSEFGAKFPLRIPGRFLKVLPRNIVHGLKHKRSPNVRFRPRNSILVNITYFSNRPGCYAPRRTRVRDSVTYSLVTQGVPPLSVSCPFFGKAGTRLFLYLGIWTHKKGRFYSNRTRKKKQQQIITHCHSPLRWNWNEFQKLMKYKYHQLETTKRNIKDSPDSGKRCDQK